VTTASNTRQSGRGSSKLANQRVEVVKRVLECETKALRIAEMEPLRPASW
jgi:hypothetical protein